MARRWCPSRCVATTVWPARSDTIGDSTSSPTTTIRTPNHNELFTRMDIISDEGPGHFDERPWHEHYPMYPRPRDVDVAMVDKWGATPGMGFIR